MTANDATEAQRRAVTEFTQAITGWGACLANTLAPIVEQIGRQAAIVYAEVREEYRRQGAPYGDTDEGFQLWIEHLGRLRRLQEEAERARFLAAPIRLPEGAAERLRERLRERRRVKRGAAPAQPEQAEEQMP